MKNFEIPSDMRKFAEQSVEQARQAFGGFINAAQKAASDMEGRASMARTGAKDVSEKAVSFAQRNIMASFEFAQKLVRAKDVQEMMKLQAEYIQDQMKVLNEQAKELGESAKVAMDNAKPKF
ncbi:MAG: phasin [Pseudorhodoplanes sp.]